MSRFSGAALFLFCREATTHDARRRHLIRAARRHLAGRPLTDAASCGSAGFKLRWHPKIRTRINRRFFTGGAFLSVCALLFFLSYFSSHGPWQRARFESACLHIHHLCCVLGSERDVSNICRLIFYPFRRSRDNNIASPQSQQRRPRRRAHGKSVSRTRITRFKTG